MFIPGYGYAVAADTGGAIKGRKLDVFFQTRTEALKWGKRCVKVTILG
ncbi:3D domain-containing protein [Thermincola potens]|nr:3D domain-containing protein [Thermincola potens]